MVNIPSPIEQLHDELFEENKVKVWVKRDDLIHPEIMGNKWRKLKYNLEAAKNQNCEGLLTFGGAFSNHIAATAAAAKAYGFHAVGIIRGDELNKDTNHTLQKAHENDMRLIFVERQKFRELKQDSQPLQQQFPQYYILPEGGTNHLAIKGSAELADELPEKYDFIAMAMGTGGTLAGILHGMKGQSKLLGFSSLKGNWIDDEFESLRQEVNITHNNYQIFKDFHFGGYGRVTDELIDFINRTNQKLGLLLDPIYTGKMYFGICKLIAKGFFPPQSKILVIHTGGLQGIVGYNEKAKKKILL